MFLKSDRDVGVSMASATLSPCSKNDNPSKTHLQSNIPYQLFAIVL